METKLVHDWRIRTERNATEDEFNVLVSGLFRAVTLLFNRLTRRSSRAWFRHGDHPGGLCPQVLGARAHLDRCQILSRYAHFMKNPNEVARSHRQCRGRLQAASNQPDRYRLGTATTFDAISEKGNTWAGPSVRASASPRKHCSPTHPNCPGWISTSPPPPSWAKTPSVVSSQESSSDTPAW